MNTYDVVRCGRKNTCKQEADELRALAARHKASRDTWRATAEVYHQEARRLRDRVAELEAERDRVSGLADQWRARCLSETSR